MSIILLLSYYIEVPSAESAYMEELLSHIKGQALISNTAVYKPSLIQIDLHTSASTVFRF